MLSIETITMELARARAEIEAEYPIRLIGVFGSAARGTAREGSDVDVLATERPGLTLVDMGAIERRLGQCVGANVDLVLEGGLKPVAKRSAMSDLRLF